MAHESLQAAALLAALQVPDEIVIGFFSAVVIGLCAAIGVLWKELCCKDRD